MTCVLAAAALICAGCAVEDSTREDPLAVGPDLQIFAAPAGRAASAFEAAGGIDAWRKAGKIPLDCVVTFFQKDGSFYLTEQRYEVFPWSNSMRISGDEPDGAYTWQLLQGRFGILKGKSLYDGLEVGADNACIAEGILSVITAPVRLLDQSVDFKWAGEEVKLDGQWYRAAKRTSRSGDGNDSSLRDAAFYQRRSSGRVDMVLLRCRGAENMLIVRGHDYTLLGKGGVMIPSKIEVFNADASGRVRHRILQIDLK